MPCQPRHPLLQGWHLSPSCPRHTIPSLNSKSHVWGSDPGASNPTGGEGGSLQPEHPSLFCSAEGCQKSEAIYRQTGIPGEYYSSDRDNKIVRVVHTDGKTYAVIFVSREKDGKTLHMLRLYSRTRQVRPKITALFKKLAREKSFTNEMIRMLPSQDECSLDEA
uniref:Lipocalin/cytosolic fatty-acid binding domain-containing protein n=1 Tax=Athene cunicularia TaxID=194338 RepID=A0A663NEI4_ATHCN